MVGARIAVGAVAIVSVIGVAGLQWVAHQANAQDARERVASCERGNRVRAYLAADNGDRITRIRTRLSSRDDPAAPAEVPELRAELARRLASRADLLPFPCDSLR